MKKTVPKKFRNIYRKVAGRPATLLKADSTQMFSCEYYEISMNNHFEEHLLTTASDFLKTATEQR